MGGFSPPFFLYGGKKMGKFEIKYPCGLKIKGKSFNWSMGDEEIDQIYEKGCPLHGKKCNRGR